MHLKPDHRRPSEERDSCDAAQPWLDFGRWLAGEVALDEANAADHSQRVPSFASIAERHFRDLVPYAAHGNSLELRRAMHRRFIQALHLAFGSEDLNDLAASQPLHLVQLIEHLRADFDLLPERSDAAECSARFAFPASTPVRHRALFSSRARPGFRRM